MREITEGLKPIKEGIENLPQTITLPAFSTIQAFDKPPEGEDICNELKRQGV